MSTVEKFVPAAPEHVWAVLADPGGYAFWVVGSHEIRGVEGDWPRPGSKFHHTQGHGPIKLKDDSVVVACDEPRRLELKVNVRPFLTARVVMELRPERDGTCITMTETVEGGMLGAAPNFVHAPFLGVRNADALRRLAAMAWARSRALDAAVPASVPA